MSSKKQQKKQDKQSLGNQPEAGDDLDERQRLGAVDDGRRAQADDSGSAKEVERERPARSGQEDNDAGQNRLNEV